MSSRTWLWRLSAAARVRPGRRRARGERHLVCVLEVAADQPTLARRHGDAVAETVGEVGGGGLAGHRRVRREDDLFNCVLYPIDEQADPEIARLDRALANLVAFRSVRTTAS